jgi:archaellum component FlaF (FlaF/FlaG flagellin family)
LGFSGVAAFSIIMVSCLIMGTIFFNTVQRSLPDLHDAEDDERERWDARRLASIEILNVSLEAPDVSELSEWESTYFEGPIKTLLETIKWSLEISNDFVSPLYYLADMTLTLVEWAKGLIAWLEMIRKAFRGLDVWEEKEIVTMLGKSITEVLQLIFAILALFLKLLDLPLALIKILAEGAMKIEPLVEWGISSMGYLLEFISEPVIVGLIEPYNRTMNSIYSALPPPLQGGFKAIQRSIDSRLPFIPNPTLKIYVKNTGSTNIETQYIDIFADGVYLGRCVNSDLIPPEDSCIITVPCHAEMPERVKIVTSNGVSCYWSSE